MSPGSLGSSRSTTAIQASRSHTEDKRNYATLATKGARRDKIWEIVERGENWRKFWMDGKYVWDCRGQFSGSCKILWNFSLIFFCIHFMKNSNYLVFLWFLNSFFSGEWSHDSHMKATWLCTGTSPDPYLKTLIYLLNTCIALLSILHSLAQLHMSHAWDVAWVMWKVESYARLSHMEVWVIWKYESYGSMSHMQGWVICKVESYMYDSGILCIYIFFSFHIYPLWPHTYWNWVIWVYLYIFTSN